MPKEDTQFKPGQSGNPKGKPPGARSFTTKVREALEKIADGKDYTYEEALIKSVLKKAIVDGDTGTQRLIWNYLDGLPLQKMEGNFKVEQPIYGGELTIQGYDSNKKDIQPEAKD